MGSGGALPGCAMQACLVFRGLRLRRVPRTVLLRLAASGLLKAPVALLGIIGVVLLVEAAKHPCQIFGIPETFVDDGRSIGVGQNVFMKPTEIGRASCRE